MTTRRRWFVVGAVVLAAAGLALGLSLALTRGGGSGSTSTAASVGTGLAQLFRAARVGDRKADLLARWPKNPYEHYLDNLGDDCYEWQGSDLYNLCFKGGVLRSKELF